jgi:hypothetical protein
MAVADLDARAKKILFDAFWTSKGWKGDDNRHVSAEDRAHALKHRMMFPRESMKHDALIKHVLAAYQALTIGEITGAFIASLSTRRLDLRSGLGSAAYAMSTKPHTFLPDINGHNCEHCGGWRDNKDMDLDVLNFERHKWGGVRHSHPDYQYLDLRELRHALPATPEAADWKIFDEIVKAASTTPKADGPGKLETRLKDVLPSSKEERRTLIEILALAGVLVATQERSSPGEWGKAGMWRGADGVDRKQVDALFGPLRASKAAKKSTKPTKKAAKASTKKRTTR